MAKARKARTLAEQIAALDDPKPLGKIQLPPIVRISDMIQTLTPRKSTIARMEQTRSSLKLEAKTYSLEGSIM
jgi:hypothetical protein